MKIVAVFPKGGEASKNEKYVNCVENALGLREWCEQNKGELIVTDSKDGSDSGNAQPSILGVPEVATRSTSLWFCMTCVLLSCLLGVSYHQLHAGHMLSCLSCSANVR